MTKEELYNKYNGELYDEAEFYKDLDNWYDTRHIAELNAIKKEVIKSFKEMDEAFSAGNEVEIRGCTAIAPGEDCMSSELCSYCDNPPKRFLKGYDCYD